jgi:Ethanolamine utilization protein EutJ (predicted chaperonin)
VVVASCYIFVVVRDGIMIVWLSSFEFVEKKKITLLFFLGCSFPHCVGIFHLLSFVGLDFWKDIVYILS